MSRRTTRMLKTLLSTLHYSGVDLMMAPYTRGLGAIFKLHHVRPDHPGVFEPNRNLKLTPDFLDRCISLVRMQGFEIISLDEAHFRLIEGSTSHQRPFVCFTFDDGYRDNLEYAYPIFRRHNLPFAVYVATSYVDGHGDLWWLALEQAIARTDAIDVKIDGRARRLACGSLQEKEIAYQTLYWWLRTIDERDARAIVHEIATAAGIDVAGLCRREMMTWDEIRQLAAEPLATIGAHTRRHYPLAQLSLAEARAEMAESIDRVSFETDQQCRHFAYPYGDAASAGVREFDLARELNMKTAVTTRRGPIFPDAAQNLTALPRVPLSGDYQKARYVKVLLTGAPYAFSGLLDRSPKRVNAR